MTRFTLSERAACKLVGLARTTYRYQPKKRDEESLVTRLKELAMAYPRYGYLLLHSLLKREGRVVNKKRTYRLYTEQGLQVRTKQRKKLVRPRLVMDRPTAVNQRWSMDFVSDQLATGRRFRVLNIVDDFSREMVGQLVSISISGHQVARYLSELIEVRGKPEAIVCDNELPTLSSHFQKKESHQQPSKWCHKIFALVPMTLSNAYHSTQRSKLIGLNQLHTAILK